MVGEKTCERLMTPFMGAVLVCVRSRRLPLGRAAGHFVDVVARIKISVVVDPVVDADQTGILIGTQAGDRDVLRCGRRERAVSMRKGVDDW